LPDEIGELKELVWLNVGNKQLTVLLWVLYLSYNQLTTLPDEIGELKELVWLNVGNNRLTVLSSLIKHLSSLWVLYLSYNQLTTLPDEIGELKELVWLNVGNNQLTVISLHIRNHNKLGTTLQHCNRRMHLGIKPSRAEENKKCNEALQLVSYLDNITEKDGVLCRTVYNSDGQPKQLLVVPNAMRSKVLKTTHNDSGH